MNVLAEIEKEEGCSNESHFIKDVKGQGKRTSEGSIRGIRTEFPSATGNGTLGYGR